MFSLLELPAVKLSLVSLVGDFSPTHFVPRPWSSPCHMVLPVLPTFPRLYVLLKSTYTPVSH